MIYEAFIKVFKYYVRCKQCGIICEYETNDFDEYKQDVQTVEKICPECSRLET